MSNFYVRARSSHAQKLQFCILVKQYPVCRGAFIVEFLAVSVCVQKFTYKHFGHCILAFDAAHVVATCFFGVDICH
jgi:hypothetical protein